MYVILYVSQRVAQKRYLPFYSLTTSEIVYFVCPKGKHMRSAVSLPYLSYLFKIEPAINPNLIQTSFS